MQPNVSKFCLNLCYFNLVLYSWTLLSILYSKIMFLNVKSILLELSFAWPADRPIFQEEDEDMTNPIDYFIV